VKGKSTWIAASQLQTAAEELAAGDGTLPEIQAAGIESGIFPNSKPGQESLIITNNIISPKTKESYSAYLFKNKRLWVAAVVIDVAGNVSYAIPTPYAGVYYYKSKGGDADGNTGIARTWTFPDVNQADGISTTAFSMDLPLGGQVISGKQASSGEVSSNYVIESDNLTTSLKTIKAQQFVIYVPYETLQTSATASVGPVRFIKDGEVFNALSSGKVGNGTVINQDNVLVTSDGDTITTTNQSDLGKVPLLRRGRLTGNSSTDNNTSLLSVAIAAVAGIAGASLITKKNKNGDKNGKSAIEESRADNNRTVIDTRTTDNSNANSYLFTALTGSNKR
jgi:hypothetical protein